MPLIKEFASFEIESACSGSIGQSVTITIGYLSDYFLNFSASLTNLSTAAICD